MLPWQSTSEQQQRREALELDSEDEGEDSPLPPPPQYFQQCRLLFPLSSRIQAMQAWGTITGVGAGTAVGDKWDIESTRVQAALGAFVDIVTSSHADYASVNSSPASTATSKRRRSVSPPAAFPGDHTLFRRQSSSPPPGPRSKRARAVDEAAGPGGCAEEKGRGKAKEVLLMSSDNEDDAEPDTEEEPDTEDDAPMTDSIEFVAPRPRQDKGKGRADSPPRRPNLALSAPQPRPDVLSLSSDSDELIFSRSCPGPSTSAAQPKPPSSRRVTTSPDPAVLLPSLPTPPSSPLTRVLQVIPDVLPSHARQLLDTEAIANDPARAVEALLNGASYPKVGEDEAKKAEKEKVDWADVAERKKRGEVPSVLYKRMALDDLYASFPLLPSSVIRTVYVSVPCSTYFAPSYLTLDNAYEKGEYDDKKLKKGRKARKTLTTQVQKIRIVEGQEVVEMVEEEEETPEELRREMAWVKEKILKERQDALLAKHEAAAAAREASRIERVNERARQNGEAVECGCCFDEVAVENAASCDGGHLFCKSCCAANASNQLGKREAGLPCMAPDCTSGGFSPTSWKDFLPAKTIDALDRLSQEQEVGKAFEGIEGFEGCPFCPYAYFIENPNERLFHCQRAECMKVSCRKCKKEGHVPLTCEEADRESRAAGVHAVAEAMSAAFIRNCSNPKCGVPTAKIDGCNHMVCSQCKAHWCYICRALIKGYEHFIQDGCPQFDDTDMRNFNEIEAARARAEGELDERTRADAAKLAAEKPERNAPRRAPALPAPPANPYHGVGAIPYPHPREFPNMVQYNYPAVGGFGHILPPYPAQQPFVPQGAGGGGMVNWGFQVNANAAPNGNVVVRAGMGGY
ncbi:hypothetical protein JCM11641_007318 [Rhodosporidiobolus odoratus]